MNEISIFLANNYIWFVIVDVLLIFALIGYLVENKKKVNKNETEVLETIKFEENPDETIEQLTTQMGDKANKSLNSVISDIETLDDQQNEVETLK